ncbi:MAG: Crp/Fnr family transcriptional regulator [Flavobacteriales bacterium]
MLNEIILKTLGTVLVKRKEDIIFNEGEKARYYFQIKSGEVEMFNLSSEGKKYTQGIFTKGESFGEPPLFTKSVYPASSIAKTKVVIWVVEKNLFLNYLTEEPKIQMKFIKMLATRLEYKALMVKEVSLHTAEHRIRTLLKHFKLNLQEQIVPFTRKEMAEMCGLTVETVIREVKKLEKEGILELQNRKIVLK